MNSNVLAALLGRINALEERMNNAALNAVQPWHNLGAGATTPLVTDDSSLGYGKGSVWVSDSATYICRDSSVGAAVWDDVSSGGGPPFGGDVDDLTTNTGVAGQMVRVAGAGGLEYRNPATVRTDIGATTVGGNVFTSTNPSAIAFLRANADNTVSWLNAASTRTALGATTVGSNIFTAANPSAVTWIRVNADNSVSFLTSAQMQTALDYVTIGTTQTVTGAKTFERTVSSIGATNEVKQIVRAGTGQTANLTEWQNNAGTSLTRVNSVGFVLHTSSVAIPNSIIDGQLRIKNTLATAQGHAGIVLDKGASSAVAAFGFLTAGVETWDCGAFNDGSFFIRDYDFGNFTVRFKVLAGGQVLIPNSSAATTPLVVRAATAQTANLQEWQDVAGAMLSAIDADGIFRLADDTKRATQRTELGINLRATILPFHAEADGTIGLTNQTNAETFLASSDRNITKFDLTQYTQCRLITRVMTGSASVNNPRLRVRYRTTFSTTVGDYSDIGTSEVSTSLTSTGVIDSGWVNLAAGAMADVFVTITQLGGDGAADPAYGMVMVHFR